MKKWYFVLIATVLAATGCAALQGLVQQPTVAFDSVSMKDLSLVDATAVFRFTVTNPNPIGLNLANLTYRMTIDGREFVKGDFKQGLLLPANDVRMVELPIRIHYLDFFGAIAEFLKKDTCAYDLSGTFDFGLFTIPYNHTGAFAVPKLPRVTITSVDVRQMSLAGADLMFQLEMANENDFAVALQNLEYGIKIGGIPIADGKVVALKPLTDQGRQVLEVPVHLNFLSLGQTAYHLLKEGTATYEVTGNMGVNIPQMGLKAVPFTRSGRVDFGNR